MATGMHALCRSMTVAMTDMAEAMELQDAGPRLAHMQVSLGNKSQLESSHVLLGKRYVYWQP